MQQVRGIAELDAGGLQHTTPFDIHLVGPRNQDVADLFVGQQRLQRPQAEHVIEHAADKLFAIGRAHIAAQFISQLACACFAHGHQGLAL